MERVALNHRAQTGLLGQLRWFCCITLIALSELSVAAGEGTQLLTADISSLEASAAAGDVAAQDMLGKIYEEGVGVLQNFKAAAYWRQQAASAGHAGAQNALGRQLAAGIGVAANPARARRWLEAAALQGDPLHVHDLAAYLDEGPDPQPMQAAEWYQRASAAGHVPSLASLGLLYLSGRGVQKDNAKALKLLTKAADMGNARAQNNLGLMYTRGDGVSQDYARAATLFSKAAAQNLPQALTNLGVMYENGFGVPLDEERARQLYTLGGQLRGNTLDAVLQAIGIPFDERLVPMSDKDISAATQLPAAMAGDPVAQYLLAGMLTSGAGIARDLPRAAHWYAAAAESGLHSAMLNLGLFYMRGQGVLQDYVSGYRWIARAAASGAQAAVSARDAILPHIPPQQVDEALSDASAR